MSEGLVCLLVLARLPLVCGQNHADVLCPQVTANHCGQPCNEALTETAAYVLDECKPKGQETRPHASISNLSQEVV